MGDISIKKIFLIFIESWQIFTILFLFTSWIIYHEFNKKYFNIKNRSGAEQIQQKSKNFDYSIDEINANNRNYMMRIETEFQEFIKIINENEIEMNTLRREKWQSDLQTRAWRHACRDAQQMVWALQRQGCAAGSELTHFKTIEPVNIILNDSNKQYSE